MTGLEIAAIIMAVKGVGDLISTQQQSQNTQRGLKMQSRLLKQQAGRRIALGEENAQNLLAQGEDQARMIEYTGGYQLAYLRDQGKRSVSDMTSKIGSSGAVVSSRKNVLMTQMLANKLNETIATKNIAIKSASVRRQADQSASMVRKQAEYDAQSILTQSTMASYGARSVAQALPWQMASGVLGTTGNIIGMDYMSGVKGNKQTTPIFGFDVG